MDPAHEQADFLDRDSRRIDSRGQHAHIEHGEAIADRQQLVEILGDDDNRRPGGGEVDQRLMNARRRPGVDSPGRLGGDKHDGVLQ